MIPNHVVDGLAIYRRGSGPPVILVPYPHASTEGPMSEGPVADACVSAGFEVVTFDPPERGRSTRPSRIGIDEMVGCTGELSAVVGTESPVPVIGHSMSALCAFMFTVREPESVSHLVVVGLPPGGGWSIVRARGMPFNWPPWDGDFWRGLIWSMTLGAGRGSLAMHKKRDHLWSRASFVDQRFVPELRIDPSDSDRPPPERDSWWRAINRLRLIPLASDIQAPTLVVVGRHDPVTPMRVSVAVHDRLEHSTLEVFDRSGHAPFIEERALFEVSLARFLDGSRPTG